MQLLSNLFRVCAIYMLTSLISLQQGNVKNNKKKTMKIVSIEGESLHIFWTTWGTSMDFQERRGLW